MEVASIIRSIVRKSGVFALVVTVLALVARVEPQKQPEPKRYPSMAKVKKKQAPAAESSGWHKGYDWRRNG